MPSNTKEELKTEEEEEEEEEDLNSSPSTSFDDPPTTTTTTTTETPPPAAVAVATATATATAVAVAVGVEQEEEKKPLAASDDSRRLFQRLWTDSDEIGLLQGFLDYTTQRGGSHNSSYHLDTALFYDQIKSSLQLDFNKNQLVEKLRRLKKKYRNAMNRMTSGKDFSFKSPHDQQAFEISHKIWSATAIASRVQDAGAGIGIEEEDQKPPLLLPSNDHNNDNTDHFVNVNGAVEKKVPRPRKRSRPQPQREIEEISQTNLESSPSIANVVEDTVRSCLSPMFKELFYSAVNGGSSNSGGLGGLVLNPVQLGRIGANLSGGGEVMDDKWRKQQILELEVYLKRVELVQEEIKSRLQELKSNGN